MNVGAIVRGVFSVFALVCTMLGPMPARAAAFVTEPGTGPDKWASAWLLSRFADAASVHVTEEPTSEFPGATLFDALGARYDRSAVSTTYASLLAAFDVNDPVAVRVGERIHEIEIDAWRIEPSLESRVLEQAFRGMQLDFGRDAVTQRCYLQFFDAVAAALASGSLAGVAPSSLRPDAGCLQEGGPARRDLESGPAVETLELSAVLRHVGDGDDVVFVDTRERWEFEEGHVPGAVNLPVRDIDADAAERFADADLVIAYCVKDFRGYEAAKALGELGVSAAIMKPHGMRGWIAAGLPVAVPDADGRATQGPDGTSAPATQARRLGEREATLALRALARSWPASAPR